MSVPAREEYLKVLASACQDDIVVTCLGMATHQWNRIQPKPSHFSLADSMGQAIPVAAGIAMAQPNRRVIVMEGDGGLLMNLGCLATTADLGLENLLILLFDNRVYEASGNQPLPGEKADFAHLASASGIPHSAAVEQVEDFRRVLTEALNRRATSFISLRIQQETELVFPPYQHQPWEVAGEFRRWAKSQKETAEAGPNP